MPFVSSVRGSYGAQGRFGKKGITATGGTVSAFGSYTIHAFTQVGASTFTLNDTTLIDVLLVAGGGAGGPSYGDQDTGKGGGGAGGVVFKTNYALTAQAYSL
jgi:hypothetical protein